jgi:chaperonin cofactor prefoldin
MDTKFDQLERKIDSLEKKFESLESRVQKIEQFQDDLLAHLSNRRLSNEKTKK